MRKTEIVKKKMHKTKELFLENIAVCSCINQSQNKNIIILVIKYKIAINMFSNTSPQKNVDGLIFSHLPQLSSSCILRSFFQLKKAYRSFIRKITKLKTIGM